jgi:hypothetical protein
MFAVCQRLGTSPGFLRVYYGYTRARTHTHTHTHTHTPAHTQTHTHRDTHTQTHAHTHTHTHIHTHTHTHTQRKWWPRVTRLIGISRGKNNNKQTKNNEEVDSAVIFLDSTVSSYQTVKCDKTFRQDYL